MFLTLGSNGIDALRVLDAADPVLSAGFATPAIVLRSGTGKRLGESVMTTREATGTTSRTMKRAELYGALHERALIFGRKAFFGYALSPDGEVWWFANVPRRDEPTRGELRAVETERWRARLLELFAADAGPALPLIRATPAGDFAR